MPHYACYLYAANNQAANSNSDVYVLSHICFINNQAKNVFIQKLLKKVYWLRVARELKVWARCCREGGNGLSNIGAGGNCLPGERACSRTTSPTSTAASSSYSPSPSLPPSPSSPTSYCSTSLFICAQL